MHPGKDTVTRAPVTQRGYSMIEVLVSLVVLAVGLLGVAGLQSSGMRHTYASNTNGQATVLARNMIDRMRANPEGIRDGEYDGMILPPQNSKPDCSGASCTAQQIALVDEHEWDALISDRLPAGTAGIRCLDATCEDHSPYQIRIVWDADGDGQASLANCSSSLGADACYEVTFIPYLP